MSGIGMAGVGVAGVAAALSIGLAADADCHGGQPVGAAAGAAPCDLYAATAASTVGGGMFGNEKDSRKHVIGSPDSPNQNGSVRGSQGR